MTKIQITKLISDITNQIKKGVSISEVKIHNATLPEEDTEQTTFYIDEIFEGRISKKNLQDQKLITEYYENLSINKGIYIQMDNNSIIVEATVKTNNKYVVYDEIIYPVIMIANY